MSGLNDTIIQASFNAGGASVDDRGRPDLELVAEGEPGANPGVFETDVAEGDFVMDKPKRNSKAKIIGFAVFVIVVVSLGFMVVVQQTMNKSAEPDFDALKSASQAAKTAEPMMAPVIQTPVADASSQQQPAAAPAVADTPPVGPASVPLQAGMAPSTTAPSAAVQVPVQSPQVETKPVVVQVVAPEQKTPVAAPQAKPVAEKAPEVKVAAPAKPQPAPASSPVAKPAPVTKAPPAPVAKAPAPAPTLATKGSAIEPPSIEAKRPVSNDVRPLVVVTPGQIGMKSLTADGLVVNAGNSAHTYRIGDSLPTGERITFIDAAASTIVTDKKIIRVAN